MRAPSVDIEGCRRSFELLLDRIADLDDERARAPSLLPDWTVGHVLTHIARSTDSVVRRLEGATRREVVDQYPGGYAGRAADIAAGAGRAASELVDDVRRSADHLGTAFTAVPEEAWDRLTRDVTGTERPARELPLACWREVELHHVDLGLGYSPADWPERMVAALTAKELERLPKRTDPRLLLAWMVGRAPAPDLARW